MHAPRRRVPYACSTCSLLFTVAYYHPRTGMQFGISRHWQCSSGLKLWLRWHDRHYGRGWAETRSCCAKLDKQINHSRPVVVQSPMHYWSYGWVRAEGMRNAYRAKRLCKLFVMCLRCSGTQLTDSARQWLAEAVGCGVHAETCVWKEGHMTHDHTGVCFKCSHMGKIGIFSHDVRAGRRTSTWFEFIR